MGSEVPGPGVEAAGTAHAAVRAARAWAVAAAQAATRVPARNGEADAWIVRGWADVAVGCIALGASVPGSVRRRGAPGGAAFSGLDEVVRARRLTAGGHNAVRLRELRQFAGPVPGWYPGSGPVAGRIREIREVAWRAADLLTGFGRALMTAADGLPWQPPVPVVSARQLAWGRQYRPSPSDAHVTMRLPIGRRLARRTWMCLPGLPSPATVIAEVLSPAAPLAQQIWRGIHEGAHLDHLAALARIDPGGTLAPGRGEFGAELMLAESYAMAVEVVAAVECLLAREGQAAWQLGAGLIERCARLPGGTDPAAEFTALPTLAEVYVLGPLEVLAGGAAFAALPAELTTALQRRWRAACAAYPAAARFGSAAAELIVKR